MRRNGDRDVPNSRLVVAKREVPSHGLLDGFVSQYADAFSAALPPGVPVTPDRVAARLFGDIPGWVRSLVRLRDLLVRPFGLRTAHSLLAEPEVKRLGMFTELGRASDAVLLGEDDRHLDFRVLVLVQPDAGGSTVTLATCVRFHNWLGRAYFLPVKPFHRIIVPALLRRTLRAIARAST